MLSPRGEGSGDWLNVWKENVQNVIQLPYVEVKELLREDIGLNCLLFQQFVLFYVFLFPKRTVPQLHADMLSLAWAKRQQEQQFQSVDLLNQLPWNLAKHTL